MSTREYHDLFLKCQGTGKYQMFCFDRVNSRYEDTKIKQSIQDKMIELMNAIYLSLQEIEKLKNEKILVFEEGFVSFGSEEKAKGFGYKYEPFIFGDAFGFTIYGNSLDKNIVLKLFEYHKKRLKIDFEFHIMDGYYETNDYNQRHTKYFRSYCLDVIMNYHKPYMQDELQKAKKLL